eukprot:jgi/Tetstr1/455064/TSEL_041919.t1
MDDLLKKLPEHWRTAFMCLADVCRHYLKADLALYAKLGESEASRLGRIMEINRAIDSRRGDGVANLKRFAKIREHLCDDTRLMCSNLHVLVEKARGCTAREVEMFLERGMRLEDFELLFNDLLVSMRRDRGSVGGSAAAKNRHAHQDAVGRALDEKVVEEACCEEGVNVHDHNAALFKQYVDHYRPDGLQVQQLRDDTPNIK